MRGSAVEQPYPYYETSVQRVRSDVRWPRSPEDPEQHETNCLSVTSYLPIYYMFGMIVAPFVLPYYNNPELGLNLVVPSVGVILPLEIGRGLLYALTLFPLIAVLRGGYWSKVLWVGLTISVLGPWVPMLQAVHWTPVLRDANKMN